MQHDIRWRTLELFLLVSCSLSFFLLYQYILCNLNNLRKGDSIKGVPN